MRPRLLEVEGFTAFRDRQCVDFEDAELFALVGPTGAGKSSVIDAICFVLYGSVPRYDDRRLVAPVISQGRNEARVRLDFDVGDNPYTAVRVVRRTKTGASTREARLESGAGDVLAGDADEVGDAVTRLLGLSYDHFTKCVVLPQGEFARFLHDKPKDRQALLVKLLDLGLYAEIARRARRRADTAKTEVELVDAQLQDLAFATADAHDVACRRVDELRKLQRAIDEFQTELADIDSERTDLKRNVREATDVIERLESISVPDGIDSLGRQLTDADNALAVADAAVRGAEDAHDAAVEAAAQATADRPTLTARSDAFRRRAELRSRCDTAHSRHDEAAADAAAAADAVQSAATTFDAAQADLDALRNAHRAHVLAAELVAGDACPVCLQAVRDLPEHEEPDDLSAAQVRVREAAGTVDEARRAVSEADARVARCAGELAGIQAELAGLDTQLDSGPSAEQTRERLAEIERIEAEVATAANALRDRRAEHRRAIERRTAAADAIDTARRSFDAVRDRVAALDPPRPARDAIDSDWYELAEWARTRLGDAVEAKAKLETRLADLDTARGRAQHEIEVLCGRAGLELAGDEPKHVSAACGDALASALAEVSRVEDAMQRAADLRSRRDVATETKQVAAELGRLLDARNFEAWVLDEVLDMLVADASARLEMLSSGRYAFALDSKVPPSFSVVDHRNADEHRPARTLSGGETFLASLALALALAERIGDLSFGGARRLDALFLDEGFGTLDPETLDVVAAAIEELGARGRMVGLVTHVRELAERVPVRFEVSRGARGSSIERVDR